MVEALYQKFDFIVCAIPFSSLRNVNVYPMFSPGKMQSIKEVFYTSAQKTIFMCKERFWEKGTASRRIIGGGSSTDLPIETIWYPGYPIQEEEGEVLVWKNNAYSNNGGVLLASYNLGQDAIRVGNLEEQTRVADIKRQVEAVHGLPRGYLDSVVEDYKTVDWNREKSINGAFCYFMPEQQKLFSYEMAQPEYNNKVYFAGEHISLTHGWIEGSVSTAMKAANAIAQYMKIRS